MSVSVIIPALNEESTVAGVIRACLADDPLEVLVIDADSTDETAAVARAAGASSPVLARRTSCSVSRTDSPFSSTWRASRSQFGAPIKARAWPMLILPCITCCCTGCGRSSRRIRLAT